MRIFSTPFAISHLSRRCPFTWWVAAGVIDWWMSWVYYYCNTFMFKEPRNCASLIWCVKCPVNWWYSQSGTKSGKEGGSHCDIWYQSGCVWRRPVYKHNLININLFVPNECQLSVWFASLLISMCRINTLCESHCLHSTVVVVVGRQGEQHKAERQRYE